VSPKSSHLKLSVTVSNLNRFSIFSTAGKRTIFTTYGSAHLPTHLGHVATPPWKIKQFSADIYYGHCACTTSRDLRVGGHRRPHIWNPRPQFVYLLYNFYGATMTIKGSLLSRVRVVSDFRSNIFCFYQKLTFVALDWGQMPSLIFVSPKSTRLCDFAHF